MTDSNRPADSDFVYLPRVLQRALTGPHWRLAVATICFLVSICFASPPLELITHLVGISSPATVIEKRPELAIPFNFGGWPEFQRKTQSLLYVSDAAPDSHYSKLAFRLSVPAIAQLLHLGPRGTIGFQLCCGFFSIWLLAGLIEKVSASRELALLGSLN